MNNYNWLIAELVLAQRAHDLVSANKRVQPERANGGGLRQALGSAFVRLGLRLDPAAGERAGALSLSTRHAR